VTLPSLRSLSGLSLATLALLGFTGCAVDPNAASADDPAGEQGATGETVEPITTSASIPAAGECRSTVSLDRDATGLVARCSSVCNRSSTIVAYLRVQKYVNGVYNSQVGFGYVGASARTGGTATARAAYAAGTYRANCEIIHTDSNRRQSWGTLNTPLQAF